MRSCASSGPPTIRGVSAPPRWNGRCRRRRRSISSKCCRASSNANARRADCAAPLGSETCLVGYRSQRHRAVASGALNMWYESDIDALMSRTANRPIPRGRITRPEALAFGVTLAFFSVMTLGILVNWVAGGLLAFTIFFYVGIYTIGLKRWTAQNIVIGGAAGALPPVVAWAAATGSLSVEPLLLFLIIFFWTPPHFWALALFRSDDYARAGVPMLPVVAGPDATRLQILLYTIVLVAVAFAPWPLGYFDAAYGVTSLVLGAGMLVLAVNVYRRREGSAALRATRKLFAFSILYLFALFATLLIEVVVRAIAPSVW